MQFKLLEKNNKEQTKPKPSQWQEIIKSRTETNEIETKKITQKSTNLRAAFQKRNKAKRSLAQVTKRKNKRNKITSIRNEQRNIVTDTKKMENIIRDGINTQATYRHNNKKRKLQANIPDEPRLKNTQYILANTIETYTKKIIPCGGLTMLGRRTIMSVALLEEVCHYGDGF